MQVVGYSPGGLDPATIQIATDGTVETRVLESGTQLSFALGERHCAGVLDDDRHVSCEAGGTPYCDEHVDRWPCARCTGNCDLPLENCREEHAIYLAAFAPAAFKVGVTKSWRLERRLREQGADRGAHLRTVANGRIAREIEAEIASDVGDSVRVATKIGGLHREVDEDAWRELLTRFEPTDTWTFERDFDLDERPMAETILDGTVRGVSGRALVLERDGGTYAVDLRDVLGHEVSEGTADRALQSSLGAFD